MNTGYIKCNRARKNSNTVRDVCITTYSFLERGQYFLKKLIEYSYEQQHFLFCPKFTIKK